MATPAPNSEKPRIKLYWLNKSRSQRILWLLEELNLPCELEIFHRDPKTMLAPPELKQIHALGKSPILSITPPGGSPTLIAESAVIVEYLLDHFAEGTTLLPKRWKDGEEGKVGGETEEWMRFRYFMHYAEGSLMPVMLMALVANNIKTSPVPFFIRPITNAISGKIKQSFTKPNFETHFTFLENQLKTAPNTNGEGYLCGPNLTGADILLSFPLIAGRSPAGISKDIYPALNAYIDKLEEEKGYKKAVEKIIEIEGSFETNF